jgi:hypothetical protein
MQNHRSQDPDQEDGLTEEARDNAVLNRMLLDRPSYPWSTDEIACELQDPLAAEDAVNRLVAAGLVHSLDGFVWPSRAARRAEQIGVGSV